MTVSDVLPRHLTFDDPSLQKDMATTTHKVRLPKSEHVSTTAQVGSYVFFKPLLKRAQKCESIAARLKLNRGSESARPGNVKIKQLKQAINRNKCVTMTRQKQNMKNGQWPRKVATYKCLPHKHPKIQLVQKRHNAVQKNTFPLQKHQGGNVARIKKDQENVFSPATLEAKNVLSFVTRDMSQHEPLPMKADNHNLVL